MNKKKNKIKFLIIGLIFLNITFLCLSFYFFQKSKICSTRQKYPTYDTSFNNGKYINRNLGFYFKIDGSYTIEDKLFEDKYESGEWYDKVGFLLSDIIVKNLNQDNNKVLELKVFNSKGDDINLDKIISALGWKNLEKISEGYGNNHYQQFFKIKDRDVYADKINPPRIISVIQENELYYVFEYFLNDGKLNKIIESLYLFKPLKKDKELCEDIDIKYLKLRNTGQNWEDDEVLIKEGVFSVLDDYEEIYGNYLAKCIHKPLWKFLNKGHNFNYDYNPASEYYFQVRSDLLSYIKDDSIFWIDKYKGVQFKKIDYSSVICNTQDYTPLTINIIEEGSCNFVFQDECSLRDQVSMGVSYLYNKYKDHLECKQEPMSYQLLSHMDNILFLEVRDDFFKKIKEDYNWGEKIILDNGLVFSLEENKIQENGDVSIINLETENHGVFIDKRTGFSFQYPKEWELEKIDDPYYQLSFKNFPENLFKISVPELGRTIRCLSDEGCQSKFLLVDGRLVISYVSDAFIYYFFNNIDNDLPDEISISCQGECLSMDKKIKEIVASIKFCIPGESNCNFLNEKDAIKNSDNYFKELNNSSIVWEKYNFENYALSLPQKFRLESDNNFFFIKFKDQVLATGKNSEVDWDQDFDWNKAVLVESIKTSSGKKINVYKPNENGRESDLGYPAGCYFYQFEDNSIEVNKQFGLMSCFEDPELQNLLKKIIGRLE